jgi:Ni,Fe-hydrogenase I small subunit
METKPRIPVLWLHGLECTCCSESFIRSGHPLAKDVILSMLSLDYDDTIMAAAGHNAEAIVDEIVEKYKGNYILAVEGNAPLAEDGMYCIIGGKQRIHDKCYRRPHFDAGQFVEHWDDEGARQGHCLYKMGCKGPTTYNACSTVGWNEGTSFPIQSGHGCIGCSEDGFWDKGSFYERLTDINQFGIEANADAVGGTAAGVVGLGIAAHAGITALNRSKQNDAKQPGAE